MKRLRTIAGAALLAASLAGPAAPPAAAQTVTTQRSPYRTPQRWAAEFRVGPYRPNIDAELDGTGRAPYRSYFGNKAGFMIEAELDYQFFRGFGTAAVGVSIGRFQKTTKAFIETGRGQVASVRSGDDTRLRLIPASLLLVYRMDEGLKRWNVPLVPYVKVGLDYTYWSITNGNDKIATFDGGKARGGSAGWRAAVGLSFALDFIDPDAARGFDTDFGVNHTYLFGELQRVDVPAFGKRDTLHVGDTTWTAGLLFEF